jgi:hypothetical protein
MGYESDTVVLFPQTTLTATGTVTGPQFFGSDWQRGYLYGIFGTVVGTTPTVLPFFQVSPNNGTTWIGASGAGAGGLITNTLQGLGTTITAITATTGGTFIIPVGAAIANAFPGTLFRLQMTVGGTPTSVPLIVYGDFQKWVPDST